ncbi:hypothetical protein [Nocardia mexicana]|uniref:Uncharacterized protein n=1 Tax=Nocardia mexicana TaxID=279262 RepID=A0A370GT69_9NOCA|nr:hypothetical protein [Nocardia mexicana]RDI46456.1 hypothetical protein DFR68_111215 [Nocardia mexicana]
MKREGLRTTTTADGKKTADWSLTRRRPWIRRVLLLGDSSPAVQWPDKLLPLAQRGMIVFAGDAGSLDLADAREVLPQHQDLWDAVQQEFWTALLDVSQPLG